MNNWVLISLGVLGVGAVVFVLRENSASANAQPKALPIPTNSPLLSIPRYPSAPPLPAFTVNATPTYQTINIQPHDEPQAQTVDPNAQNSQQPNCQKKCNGCEETINGAYVNVQKVSASRISFSANNLASVPNIQAQFPPALYPWLYQNGGTA